MTLHITVVPASTQAGRETIRTLLADGTEPNIQGIYRDTSKAPPEFISNPRFKAVQGDVSDSSCLDFTGTDAVFYIPPPTYDGTDSTEFATHAANNVKAALQKAPSVRRLLLFSAMGAEHEKGIVWILTINHVSDEILQTAVPEVVIIQPGFFMEFWGQRLETLEANPPYIESFISPADHKTTMVAVQDIAHVCSQHLLATGQEISTNPHVFSMHGPQEYSANDVKAALEQITKKEINLTVIDAGQLEEYFATHVPQPYAQEMAEMTTACLPGGLLDIAMKRQDGAVRGQTDLIDYLREVMENRSS